MSYVVNAAGGRAPSYFRATIHIIAGSLLLGGCSASSDRLSFGNSYTSQAASVSRQKAAPQPQSAADAQSPSKGGYQLASAEAPSTDGYMQVSRVDLPPVAQREQPREGVKMADGYGPYNAPPVADGVYTGPRVFTPYDGPREGPPPPPAKAPDWPRYDRGTYDREQPPEFPRFYQRSENAPPAPEARPQPGIYEPRREPEYRQPFYGERRDFGRNYDRVPDQGPGHRAFAEGRPVIVQPGDTLYSLARQYGVTVDLIARANGLSSPGVRPGTRLIIPYATPSAYAEAPKGESRTKAAACAGEHCHVVKPGETVRSIARDYRVSEQRIMEANNLPGSHFLKAGQTIAIPVEKPASRDSFASAAPQKPDAGPKAAQLNRVPNLSSAVPAEREAKPSTLEDPQPLRPAPEAKTAALPAPEPSCEAALANPLPRMGNNFRKPVEGKVIASFGPQRDGTVNEGITILAPKGTPIKAAENGVVAYVGDELPGFGNLILIRHADEYITAYAHTDAILVKKCDVVKRGQAIATAGATGDVSQPQLHFEIRKNSKPVDPAPLLGS